MPVILLYLFVYTIYAFVGLVSHIFTAISLQTIANRRNIPNAWLAWIPIINVCVIGKIADEFDSRIGIHKNYGKRLLSMYINSYALIFLSLIIFAFSTLVYSAGGSEFLSFLTLGCFVFILCVVVAYIGLITASIISYICLFKLYHSTIGEMAGLFLILSIFIQLTLPILLFICRNKGYDYSSKNNFNRSSDVEFFEIIEG